MQEILLQGKAVPLDDNYEFSLLLHKDIDDIINMLDDERVIEFLWFAPAPEQFYRDYFTPMAERNVEAIKGNGAPFTTVIIRHISNGKFAGMAAILPLGMIEGVFEIGYQLPHVEWGKGLGTRIAKVLLEYGFNTLKAHKITADCFSSNIGSTRVMEKIGMTREGDQKDFYRYKDSFDGRALYGISRQQYY